MLGEDTHQLQSVLVECHLPRYLCQTLGCSRYGCDLGTRPAVCTSLCPTQCSREPLSVRGIQGVGKPGLREVSDLSQVAQRGNERASALTAKLGPELPHSPQAKNRKHPRQTNSILLSCLLYTCCVPGTSWAAPLALRSGDLELASCCRYWPSVPSAQLHTVTSAKPGALFTF